MIERGNILITESADPILAEELSELGFHCHYQPGILIDEVHKTIGQYEGIIVATRIVVNKELIDLASRLKFIARAGSGMENIDVAYARTKNIICINSPEGNSNSVGEHALALLLAFYHNITKSFSEIKDGKWPVNENWVHELEKRTIGLIGYGNTGKAFAKKLSVFGMNVIAYDKYLRDFSDDFAREVTMNQIFVEAEIVSLHIPLTDETLQLVNQQYLNYFQKQIFLINTSRGKIINHRELLQCIRENKMLGAALDVYEKENLEMRTMQDQQVFQELIDSGKVIFTPHIAGKSFESKHKIAEVLIRKIKMFL